MAIQRRWWIAPVLLVLVLVAGVTALGVVHHLRGARFVGTVSPVQVSSEQCVDLLVHLPYGFSSQNASSTCQSATMAAWFHAEVRNVGHRMAFLKYCNLVGRDRLGQELFVGELAMFQGNPAGFPLDPGKSVAWEWYLTRQNTTNIPFQPQAQAMDYELRCPAIDYGGPPPV
jgi:hypothetical protein